MRTFSARAIRRSLSAHGVRSCGHRGGGRLTLTVRPIDSSGRVLGGLGRRSACHTGLPAPLRGQPCPPPRIRGRLVEAASARRTLVDPGWSDCPTWRMIHAARPEPPENPGAGDWPHGWQYHASQTLTEHHRGVIMLSLPPSSRALFHSQAGPSCRSVAHSHNHQNSAPTSKSNLPTRLFSQNAKSTQTTALSEVSSGSHHSAGRDCRHCGEA